MSSCEYSGFPEALSWKHGDAPGGRVTAAQSVELPQQQVKENVFSKISTCKMGESPHYPWMLVTATQLYGVQMFLCHKNYVLYISY